MKDKRISFRIGKEAKELLEGSKKCGLEFDIDEVVFEKFANKEDYEKKIAEMEKIKESCLQRIEEIKDRQKQEISPELEKELLKTAEILKSNPSYIDRIVNRINNDFNLDLNNFQLKELMKRVEK